MTPSATGSLVPELEDLRKQINSQIHRYNYPDKFVKASAGD